MKFKNKQIKKAAVFVLTGVLMVGSVFSGVQTKTAAAKKNSSGTQTEEWPTGKSIKNLTCDSAIVMELSTGTILYKKREHVQHYPASITKILTTLLAIENSSLGETVTYGKDAVYGTEPGSSSIGTLVGEKLSMEQSLYAIMLESANEVCLGVADHVAGNIPNFVKMMNARVKKLGLKDTHFANPNGLHNPKHYTSAYDMAQIAREAMKNSTFRKVTGTKRYTIPPTNKYKQTRYLCNHQQMLTGNLYPQYQYKYCIGGKTGYTQMAHCTLVTFAQKDGMELVCVIMKANSQKNGTPNQYTDTTSLLNYAFSKYKKSTVSGDESKINENLFNTYGSYFNSKQSPLHLSSENNVVLPKNVPASAAKQKITYYKNKGNLKQGENVIGKVTYTYAGHQVGSADLLYDNVKRTHLDEASRKMVSGEVASIEKRNSRKSGIGKFISKIEEGLSQATGWFGLDILLWIVKVLLGIAIVGLLIYGIYKSKQKTKRRRRSWSHYLEKSTPKKRRHKTRRNRH